MRMAPWLLLLMGMSGTLYVACQTSEESICDIECDCERCSARQFDDCVRDYDDDEFDAERRGCLVEYDDLLDCRHATWRCDGNDFETSCGREKDRFKDCVK